MGSTSLRIVLPVGNVANVPVSVTVIFQFQGVPTVVAPLTLFALAMVRSGCKAAFTIKITLAGALLAPPLVVVTSPTANVLVPVAVAVT